MTSEAMKLDHERRMHVHNHNSLHGSVMGMRAQLRRLRARSFTHAAIYLVNEIDSLLKDLDREVWTRRRELDGSIKEVKHKHEREFSD